MILQCLKGNLEVEIVTSIYLTQEEALLGIDCNHGYHGYHNGNS